METRSRTVTLNFQTTLKESVTMIGRRIMTSRARRDSILLENVFHRGCEISFEQRLSFLFSLSPPREMLGDEKKDITVKNWQPGKNCYPPG